MSPSDAFKIGFIARCVEMGVSAEKTAELSDRAESLLLTKQAINTALAYGLGLPLAVGAGAAYLKNLATDVDDDVAIDDVQKQELIDTYRQMTERLQQQTRSQAYKKQRNRTGRVFL